MIECKLDEYPLNTHTWRSYKGQNERLECIKCGEIIAKASTVYGEGDDDEYLMSVFSPYHVFPRPHLVSCYERVMKKALE